MDPVSMVVAAANWKIRPILSDREFFQHLEQLVLEADSKGADVLVLPELAILELLYLADESHSAKEHVRFLLDYADPFEEAVQALATQTGMTIVAGSHFREYDGRVLNVSLVVDRHGDPRFQPKNVMTQWESAEWGISGSNNLVLLQNMFLSVLVCYDVEFPEACRTHAESGALVLAVPSYTETRRGHQRVRWCCQARATENQVFVAHASLVGSLGREPVPSTYGQSAIFTPSIEPFPESAILSESPINEEGLAVAELDLYALLDARNKGDVRNWNDRHASQWRLVR